MTTTTPETIQEIAVNIATGYITKGASLNEGIAKVAMDMELNPEQIKRVVEASNTVTYLSLQKQAGDRTFEFSVADYNSVLGKMTLPEKTDTSVTEGQFKEATQKTEIEKEATYVPDSQTIQAWTRAEYIRNKHMLEKLAVDSEAVVQNIGDLTAQLRGDIYCLEKLAEVTTEDEFVKLARLLRPIPKNVNGEIQLEDRIFKEAELEGSKKLVELYKEGKDIVAEITRRSELEKRAFVGAIAGMVGKTLGGAAGAATSGAATGAKNLVKNIGKSKVISPLDIAATAVTEPNPKSNIWDNLQGRQRRF